MSSLQGSIPFALPTCLLSEMAISVKVPDRGVHSLKAKLLSYISIEYSSAVLARGAHSAVYDYEQCSLGSLGNWARTLCWLSPGTCTAQVRTPWRTCGRAGRGRASLEAEPQVKYNPFDTRSRTHRLCTKVFECLLWFYLLRKNEKQHHAAPLMKQPFSEGNTISKEDTRKPRVR